MAKSGRVCMKLSIILAFLISFCSPAFADIDDFAFQVRLIEDGFYTGAADGEIGPGTKAAMKAYAEANGIPNTMSDLIAHMVKRPIEKRIDLSKKSEELSSSIRSATEAAVKEQLMDPYSAVIEIGNVYISGGRYIAVCGTVNAKNSYGAFVGATAFQVLLTISIFNDYTGGDVTMADKGAEMLCLLGTSYAALLGRS
jgi:hypothetical protein